MNKTIEELEEKIEDLLIEIEKRDDYIKELEQAIKDAWRITK